METIIKKNNLTDPRLTKVCGISESTAYLMIAIVKNQKTNHRHLPIENP